MEYLLITGGLGFIGSHTVVELLNSKKNLIVVDNLSNSKLEVLEKIKRSSFYFTPERLIFVELDLRNAEKLKKIFSQYSITGVIHFASLKAVAESLNQPLEYYSNNINGTLILLQIMKEFNCKRIIFSSSATVYGDNEYPVDEMAPTGKGITNPYGQTKYMIEKILMDLHFSDSEWSIIILRYFNPIGASPLGFLGENPNEIPNNLFPYLLQVYTGKLKTLNIFGMDYPTSDGTCLRDFIHVVDLAQGHCKALLKFSEPGVHIYNLGTGRGTSVLELIHIFEKVSHTLLNKRFVERRPGDLMAVYAKVDKARQELGWVATKTVEDMCRDGLNFAQKNLV